MKSSRYTLVFVTVLLLFSSCSLDALVPNQIEIEPPALQKAETKLSYQLPVVVVDFEDARQLPEDKIGHYYYLLGDNPCRLPGFSKIVTQSFRDSLFSIGINVAESEGHPALLLGGEITDFYVLYAERPGSGNSIKQYMNLCQYLKIQLRLVDLKNGNILWEDRIIAQITKHDLWKSIKFSWTAGGYMAKVTRLSIERAVAAFITNKELHATVEGLKAPVNEPEPITMSRLDTPEMSTTNSDKKRDKHTWKSFVLFYDDLIMPVVDPEDPNYMSLGSRMSLTDVEQMLTRLAIICTRQQRHIEAERYDHWARQVRKRIREGR